MGPFDDLIPGTPANPTPGGVVIGTHPLAPQQRLQQTRTQQEIEAANVQAKYASQRAAADTSKAQSEATVAAMNAADLQAARGMKPHSDLTGEAFLATLPPARARLVHDVAVGNINLGNRPLGNPQAASVLQDVINYDPSFDMTDVTARAKANADIRSGKIATNALAINTGLEHSNTVLQALEALHNKDGFFGTQIYNPIGNAMLSATGDPRILQAADAIGKYSKETAKIFVPTGGTENDRSEEQRLIPINGSPRQQVGVLKTDSDLLRGRVDALNYMARQALGPNATARDLMSPEAKRAWDILNSARPEDFITGHQTMGLGGASNGGAPPPLGGGRGPSAGSPPGGPVPFGGPPNGPNDPQSWRYGPSAQQQSIATGDYREQYNPVLAGQLAAMVRAKRPASEINAFLSSQSASPVDEKQLQAVEDYAAQHPDWTPATASTRVPTTAMERLSASPVAAIAAGALGATTAGWDDELGAGAASLFGADYTKTRDMLNANKHALADLHPNYNLAGNVLGGVAATMGGAGLAGRLAPGAVGAATQFLGRAAPAVGDAAYGALYGAGENNDNRGMGALMGGAVGGGAGVATRGAMRGLSNVVAPDGGALAPLYDAGVFPTIGQRAAAAQGLAKYLGKPLNTFEQALQSVPLIGGLPARARNIARDQFQLGAFNSALGDIGDALPEGMPPGNQPHVYTNKALGDAYDAARSGMQFAPDPQYQAERAAFEASLDNGVLNPDQVAQVRKVINTSVDGRLGNNPALPGSAYQAAGTDLGNAESAWGRDSSTSNMASALRDYTTIFDNAARRNSDPAAVKLLDDADRGWAKFVRIQDASAARGGDSGTFTPAQFDRSVQRNSSGVRSSAYNQGDALMQDYASAGKSLVDTLPNSGSAERLMTGQAVGGFGGAGGAALGLPMAALAKPGALAFSPYLPGLNKLVTRAMAPRDALLPPALAAPLNRLGSQIDDLAPYIGKLAVPGALALLPNQ